VLVREQTRSVNHCLVGSRDRLLWSTLKRPERRVHFFCKFNETVSSGVVG